MIRDLACDPETIAGPIDVRVVEELRRRYPLDDDFVQQLAACHGAVPGIGTFSVGTKTGTVARFLTLLDFDSALTGPKRPHFEHVDTDERVMIGIPYLLDGGHQTSRTLFTNLVPFAALLDGMNLDHGYVDLLCLDCRDRTKKTPVVVWIGDSATDASMEWDGLPIEQQFDADGDFVNVPWDDFLLPVASDFGAFISSLQENTA